MSAGTDLAFDLGSELQTAQLAERLAPHLRAGDTILLHGGLGTGKTHFARALIRSRLFKAGCIEDVPSPTYTLVQTYDDGEVEIWHADLYRLIGEDDVFELGLEDAFETAICLIEWPEKLGALAPTGALWLSFEMADGQGCRHVHARSRDHRWTRLLDCPARTDADG